MLEPIADTAAVAWPLALSVATLALADRARAGRRRRALNGALHELRRPLQALFLAHDADRAPPGADRQLDLALDALDLLDREINGAGPRRCQAGVVLAELAARAALHRWRAFAARAGRAIELDWRAAAARVACDPPALARALDNLIANALEHGSGAIALRGELRTGHLLLTVLDAGAPARARPRRVTDPRRGHGLTTVAAIAAEHGGRFEFEPGEGSTRATIALPLAA
jgi:signal transduction histidine kinase